MYVQLHPGRIITKYFNEVFSKAWLKSMMPANIISGFKTCGIYLFNPRAVLDHDPTSENSEEDDSVPMADKISLHSTKEISPATSFTAEENILFTRRYENGYDIPDPRYVQWMEQNHPKDRFLDLFLMQLLWNLCLWNVVTYCHTLGPQEKLLLHQAQLKVMTRQKFCQAYHK